MYVHNGLILADDIAFSLVVDGVTINFTSKWLAESTEADRAKYGIGVVDSTPTAKVVPFSVSPAQIREALLTQELLDDVEAAVEAAGRQTSIWWEFATAIERKNPKVVAMAQLLGLTDDQLDDLFIYAGTI